MLLMAPLRRHADHLRQREAGDGLHDRRPRGGEGDRPEQVVPPLADHVVEQPPRAEREHEAAHPADEHERHADRQRAGGAST
jgi:hypothetical protein